QKNIWLAIIQPGLSGKTVALELTIHHNKKSTISTILSDIKITVLVFLKDINLKNELLSATVDSASNNCDY
ncbi:hypothetical protein PT274_02690, partial [Leuconostocaceae bacterium ESL0958]|nr:hypothetical protein [Leuconostocaceae bacterium ESL0958]